MSEPTEVRIHFIKADDYSEKPVHGVWGGPTPQGQIFMSYFSERAPIPTAVTYELRPQDGHFSLEEKQREGRDGPVRLIHSGFYLTLPMAISVRDWLTQQIESVQNG